MAIEAQVIRHHVPVTRTTLATWDAARFKEHCRKRGLTYRQVAVTSGIPYSAVRSYSTGAASPTPGRLVALAHALAVPTTTLAPLRSRCTLHELRWHGGLTIAELAARVDYSVSHTSSVLAGVSPVTDTARWSRVLGVDEQSIAQAWEAARAAQQIPGA